MKTNKIFLLTLFTTITLFFTGCAGNTPGTSGNASETAADADISTAAESDSGSALEPDAKKPAAAFNVTLPKAEELPDGELCIPSYLSGSETEGFSIVSQDGDSLTYHLTGEQRAEAAGQIAAQLDESIAQVLADKEHYPNISTVSVNEDCTEFNVTFLGTELNTYETTLRMSLYIVGDKFQLYQEKAAEELLTAVNYINEISGETFSTGTSH